jgi:hypothetical protein
MPFETVEGRAGSSYAVVKMRERSMQRSDPAVCKITRGPEPRGWGYWGVRATNTTEM